MQRKDSIILQKVLSEIDICFQMLGDSTLEVFLDDEKLKRAVAMTVINIGELVKTSQMRCVPHRNKFLGSRLPECETLLLINIRHSAWKMSTIQ